MGIFKIKERTSCRKFYFFGIMVYCIRYTESCLQHYLFGLPIFRKRKFFVLDDNILHLDTSSFHSLTLDDYNILNELQNSGKFTYIPNSGNLGDMLIAAATLQFFDAHHLPYVMYHEATSFDTIVYGGGGPWVSDYENSYTKLFPIFAKAKKIIILPSSFYKCDKLINILDERFVLFCREKQSYSYLQAAETKAKIILDHDMALRMRKDILKPDNLSISYADVHLVQMIKPLLSGQCDVGYFLRDDCEKKTHPTVRNCKNDMDLSAFGGGSYLSSRDHIFFSAMLMLSVVDSVKTVVTDRLHVGIASVLMGKNVYLLDNSYKKISNVYENSLKNLDNVFMCSDFPTDIVIEGTSSSNFQKINTLISSLI